MGDLVCTWTLARYMPGMCGSSVGRLCSCWARRTGGNEALCGMYARMEQTMEVVEDQSLELLGHIGS